MTDDKATLDLMPTLLREAVEMIAGTVPVDVFYNVRRHEALLYYIGGEDGTEVLVSVTYYPETGETHTSETTVSSEWTTGFEA